jgi:hypothetical protein
MRLIPWTLRSGSEQKLQVKNILRLYLYIAAGVVCGGELCEDDPRQASCVCMNGFTHLGGSVPTSHTLNPCGGSTGGGEVVRKIIMPDAHINISQRQNAPKKC